MNLVKGPYYFNFQGVKYYVSMYSTNSQNTTEVSVFKRGRLSRQLRRDLVALAFSYISDPTLDDVTFHWFTHRRAILCNTDHEGYFIAICEDDSNG